MTHPDELLAEYVDDALSPEGRAQVEEHLAGCARCRDEVALSRHAVAQLGRLSDRAAPSGVASAAVRESRRTKRPAAAARAPRWHRFAPVAAAAAVVLLAVIAIPRFTSSKSASAPRALEAASGSTDNSGATVPSASTAPQTTGPASLSSARFDSSAKGLERQSTNYDSASLQQLAAPPASFGQFASAGSFNAAKKCITSAEHGESGSLVRLIEARYQDTPSFLAVFLPNGLQHQSAGSPVTIIVVTTSGCSLLAVGGGTT
jgi:Putative zinc-finger